MSLNTRRRHKKLLKTKKIKGKKYWIGYVYNPYTYKYTRVLFKKNPNPYISYYGWENLNVHPTMKDALQEYIYSCNSKLESLKDDIKAVKFKMNEAKKLEINPYIPDIIKE